MCKVLVDGTRNSTKVKVIEQGYVICESLKCTGANGKSVTDTQNFLNLEKLRNCTK